ncbi:MAG: TatD family hydrolase, partial [Candidatus Nomurabacteria bacterium]|nr:TatD family hydrolase [Candidatus Nomurabacteria bacterium]
PLDPGEVLEAAKVAGVNKIICVGTDMQSSRDAVKFVTTHDNVFATLGVHPHEAKHGINGLKELLARPGLAKGKIVGIGEIGLDYYYNHSPKKIQIEILNQQIELAIKHNLPISFHVREAFDDFWPIFDNFGGKLRGVLHSFTDNASNMKKGLARGLFIGINGIATFNKDSALMEVHQTLPLDRMLLETDAPFLAPPPFRSKVNQPSYIPKIVDFLVKLRGETYEQIAAQTTANAEKLFHI